MSQTIGQQLRQARLERALTIEQVAQATHIRAHYLQALESDDFKALPSEVQVKGFLRTYADLLNLDFDNLLSILDSKDTPIETEADQTPKPTPESSGEQDIEAIFSDVGQQLKHQRELLGLSLDDVERHTHLRRPYLIALEAGNLDGLPSPVQARGMLKNYAVFLGLDPEPVLLRFADGLQAQLALKQASRPQTRSAPGHRQTRVPSPVRRLFSGDILIGGTLGIFLLVFIVWGAIRVFSMRSEQIPTPTAPSIAEVLLASPTATMSLTPEPVTPTASQVAFPTFIIGTDAQTGNIISPGNRGTIQVYISVSQRAWMRITVDGKIEFEGRVIPGSAYTFVGETSVEILTGNGSALRVIYNQQDVGVLGNFGQVVNRVFSQEGVVTPTPTITPTGTATQPITDTPMPTATPMLDQSTRPSIP